MVQTEKNFGTAAIKAGMDEKTARKYRDLGKLPSELDIPHTWRTRADPFEDSWDEIKSMLEINPGLEAKTIFEDLQRRCPGRFSDSDDPTALKWFCTFSIESSFSPDLYAPTKVLIISS